MTYQLPPTHLRNKVESFYTADQMKQAYAAGRESMPVYTHPTPKPMTEDQIYELYSEPRSDAEMVEFARAVEKHHGIGK